MAAVSAADGDRLNRVLTVTMDSYLDEISNELARADNVIAAFVSHKGVKTQSGGQRAIATVDLAENPNVGYRDRNADIPTAKGDSRKEAKYAWATIDGAVNINIIEDKMNSGQYKIHDLEKSELDNIYNTFTRKVADSLRASSPSSVEPEGIASIIQATAFGSQTGSTGELSRSTYSTIWQNQYTTTAMDLSAVTGFEALDAFMRQSCNKGLKKDRVNVAVTSGTLYAALASWAEAGRRYKVDDKMSALGFDQLTVDGVVIVDDPAIAVINAAYMYLINTNYLYIMVLRTDNMKDVGENPNSIPLSMEPFGRPYNSLNRIAILHLTHALVCSSLQRQGLAGGCV